MAVHGPLFEEPDSQTQLSLEMSAVEIAQGGGQRGPDLRLLRRQGQAARLVQVVDGDGEGLGSVVRSPSEASTVTA